MTARNFLNIIHSHIVFTTIRFVAPALHQIAYVTLALMVGIILGYVGIPFKSLFLGGTILAIAGVSLKKYASVSLLFFLLIFTGITGAFLCNWQLASVKNLTVSNPQENCIIAGTLESIEAIQNPRFRYKIIIQLAALKWASHTESIATCQCIALYTHTAKELLVADSIEIKNIKFKEIANQSFTTYLAKEKISATLFLEKFEHTLLYRPSWSIKRWFFYYKESVFKKLQAQIKGPTFALFSSIFLGNRVAVKKQMNAAKEPFKIWGISHYLARSGLHLVIFVLVWHFLLSLLPISYRIKQSFMVSLIIVYAIFSWSSISFERALLMFLISKFCLLSSKPLHYAHLVILVTFIILCINPLQLFFLDFQLSFGLTFALAWFNHIQAHKKRLIS